MITVFEGDCREMLKTLASDSVDCCVTSPPYYGLRDYGTANWQGGSSGCDHESARQKTRFDYKLDLKQNSNRGSDVKSYGPVCPNCGATRVDRQIGQEISAEEYVQTLVEVFREVRRVLKPAGTLWLNLGDSFGPNKQLLMVPHRVALALQADGWYVRMDIVWAKSNPMPESVTSRPSKSHEYIFLLAKSESYYYDAAAVVEPAVNRNMPGTNMTDTRLTYGAQNGGNTGLRDLKARYKNGDWPTTRNRRSVWTVPVQAIAEAHFATFPEKLIEPCILAGCPKGGTVLDPFAGSGTTLIVATRYGRHAIGIELSPEYSGFIQKRTSTVQTEFVL